MRTITDHKVNGLNEAINIAVIDEPGQGGANHVYELDLVGGAPASGGQKLEIRFQNGPIAEFGFNGLSNEALLAVVIDRMRGFQGMPPVHPMPVGTPPGFEGARLAPNRPPFQCRENAIALTHLEDALMWLQKRTRDRMARGVEGKNQT